MRLKQLIFVALMMVPALGKAEDSLFQNVHCSVQSVQAGYYFNIHSNDFLSVKASRPSSFQATFENRIRRADVKVALSPELYIQFQVARIAPIVGIEEASSLMINNKWNDKKPALEIRATLIQKACVEGDCKENMLGYTLNTSNEVITPNSMRQDATPDTGRLMAFGKIMLPQAYAATYSSYTGNEEVDMKKALTSERLQPTDLALVEFFCESLALSR